MIATDMLAEVRYAFRQLSRSPGFAAVALLTLALGIGANTAVFSVANAVLLRPLPYPNSDRLVMIWDQLWKVGERQLPVSAATFDAYRANGRVFEAAAAFLEDDRNLTGAGYAERVAAISATSDLFEMIGAGARSGAPSRQKTGNRRTPALRSSAMRFLRGASARTPAYWGRRFAWMTVLIPWWA